MLSEPYEIIENEDELELEFGDDESPEQPKAQHISMNSLAQEKQL